jgi:Skp family chaperone for outer membrane proteins
VRRLTAQLGIPGAHTHTAKELFASMFNQVVTRLALAVVLTGTFATAQVKIGVINSQKAMLDTAELKKAQAEMETKFKPRQARLDALGKEVQAFSSSSRRCRAS